MMAQPADNIIDAREELMVSPKGDHNPTLRAAYFLKPSVASLKEPIFELPSLSPSSLPPTFEPSKWPLKIRFSGWQYPPRKWRSWVYSLRPKYGSLWRKTGIFQAIMNSTYQIPKNLDMVIGIAERWCSKTNTFIFPWAEATLTLEDVMVLGGFSVLGEPVFRPVETLELKQIEEKLIRGRVEAGRSASRKASPGAWIERFMNSGSEIEHEALLVLWLSTFFLPNSSVINKQVFPIAILLAQGTRIALAPAFLASIYKELTLLKETIVALNKFHPAEDEEVLEVTLRSPFQLVQLWAWERFPSLQPREKFIISGDSVFARWHGVKIPKIENMRLALDSAGGSFVWRPYASYKSNRDYTKIYGAKEMLIRVNPHLDEEIEAFARCLRVSELVGLDCIEQYFPHRVAMQFGMDQDVPGYVARHNTDPEIAWNNYSRAISDRTLYVPPRLSKAGITTRYLAWWKHSILAQWVEVEDSIYSPYVFPDFPLTCIKVEVENCINEDQSASEGVRAYGMNDFVGKRATGEDKQFLGQSQCFSASGTDGAFEKTESVMPAEKGRGEAAVGGLERAMEGTTKNKGGSLFYDRVSSNCEEGSNYKTETPGLELEARISRLERVVAKLKEAHYSKRFKERPTKKARLPHRSPQ